MNVYRSRTGDIRLNEVGVLGALLLLLREASRDEGRSVTLLLRDAELNSAQSAFILSSEKRLFLEEDGFVSKLRPSAARGVFVEKDMRNDVVPLSP